MACGVVSCSFTADARNVESFVKGQLDRFGLDYVHDLLVHLRSSCNEFVVDLVDCQRIAEAVVWKKEGAKKSEEEVTKCKMYIICFFKFQHNLFFCTRTLVQLYESVHAHTYIYLLVYTCVYYHTFLYAEAALLASMFVFLLLPTTMGSTAVLLTTFVFFLTSFATATPSRAATLLLLRTIQ